MSKKSKKKVLQDDEVGYDGITLFLNIFYMSTSNITLHAISMLGDTDYVLRRTKGEKPSIFVHNLEDFQKLYEHFGNDSGNYSELVIGDIDSNTDISFESNWSSLQVAWLTEEAEGELDDLISKYIS